MEEYLQDEHNEKIAYTQRLVNRIGDRLMEELQCTTLEAWKQSTTEKERHEKLDKFALNFFNTDVQAITKYLFWYRYKLLLGQHDLKCSNIFTERTDENAKDWKQQPSTTGFKINKDKQAIQLQDRAIEFMTIDANQILSWLEGPQLKALKSNARGNIRSMINQRTIQRELKILTFQTLVKILSFTGNRCGNILHIALHDMSLQDGGVILNYKDAKKKKKEQDQLSFIKPCQNPARCPVVALGILFVMLTNAGSDITPPLALGLSGGRKLSVCCNYVFTGIFDLIIEGLKMEKGVAKAHIWRTYVVVKLQRLGMHIGAISSWLNHVEGLNSITVNNYSNRTIAKTKNKAILDAFAGETHLFDKLDEIPPVPVKLVDPQKVPPVVVFCVKVALTSLAVEHSIWSSRWLMEQLQLWTTSELQEQWKVYWRNCKAFTQTTLDTTQSKSALMKRIRELNVKLAESEEQLLKRQCMSSSSSTERSFLIIQAELARKINEVWNLERNADFPQLCLLKTKDVLVPLIMEARASHKINSHCRRLATLVVSSAIKEGKRIIKILKVAAAQQQQLFPPNTFNWVKVAEQLVKDVKVEDFSK